MLRFPLVLLIASLIFGEATAQTRDLEKYEQLIYVVDAAKESAETYQAKGRGFAWNCWIQKRRCYVSLKIEILPSPPNLLELYVEPNKEGEWSMTYLIDVQLVEKSGKPKKERLKGQFISTKVSRVEIIKGAEIKPLKVPGDQPLPADSFGIFVSANKNPLRFGAELIFKNGSTTGWIF